MEFKVGRKYKVIDGVRKGDVIEIKHIFDFKAYYNVIENNSGFNYEYNYFNVSSIFACSLELVNEKPETIVIYRKGNEVIALDKRTGKKAVAKCSPDDTYNFETGAKLEFERLTDDDTIKVGDSVKVINTGRVYTINIPFFNRNNINVELLGRFAYQDDLGYCDGIRTLEETFTVEYVAEGKAVISKYDGRCYLIDIEGLKKC